MRFRKTPNDKAAPPAPLAPPAQDHQQASSSRSQQPSPSRSRHAPPSPNYSTAALASPHSSGGVVGSFSHGHVETFSTTAITTACDAIEHRAISAPYELRPLFQSINPDHVISQQLQRLSYSMEQLRVAAENLRDALARQSVVSPGSQRALHVSVHPASDASAVIHKQIMRVEPGPEVININPNVLADYERQQDVNAQLFSLIAEVLRLPSIESQEARFGMSDESSAGSQLLSAAVEASNMVIGGGGLMDAAESPSLQREASASEEMAFASPEGEDPPEYPATESEGKGKSSNRFFSSLTHSFQAITSGMRAKPEPMVTAMCQSAKAGNVGHLKGFIAEGANINGKNEEGYTPLICAIRENQLEAVQLLLKHGANRSASDSHAGKRKPPLFHAAECGHLEITRLFLSKNGKEAKERSWSGQPFFVEVASSDHLDVIQCFLEQGVDANMTTISGRSIFMLALRRGSLEHIRLLTAYGGDPNSRDINGRPAMHVALNQDRLDIVEHLLLQGGDPNSADMTGTSILLAAAQRKSYDMMELLLSRGANPNVLDITGRPLILILLENPELDDNSRSDLMRMLLARGVDPNKSDVWGVPMMCHVMIIGNTEVLRVFLEHGGSPNNVLKRQETTLLLYALDMRRDEQFELLLTHGADPNKADKHGRTPLLEALQCEDGEHLVKKLLERGANVNQPGQVKPLAFANLLNNQEMAKMLVESGAQLPPRPQPERQESTHPLGQPSLTSEQAPATPAVDPPPEPSDPPAIAVQPAAPTLSDVPPPYTDSSKPLGP